MVSRPPRLPSLESDHVPRDERSLINKVLAGKYLVRSIIGSGGVGTVYEAIDRTLRRTVAIKVPHKTASDVILQRFLREGRAGAAIAHPNVCALYDVGPLDDGTPFLVMERLFGDTLADRLERTPKLELSALITMMTQVLSGLHAAHAQGIVHRDMKPENIFVCRPVGGEALVKVLDFGASKLDGFLLSDDDNLDALTATGYAVGTPYYMAPEQARGERDPDGRLDIFACGTIIYEALTGVRPFEGNHFSEIFKSIAAADPKPIRSLEPSLPESITPVLARAMAPSRDARYPTAGAFARALESLKHATSESSPQVREEPTSERLAYLRQRFHELAVLYRKGSSSGSSSSKSGSGGGGGRASPSVSPSSPPGEASSTEIPVFFDEESSPSSPASTIPPPMSSASREPAYSIEDSHRQRILTERDPVSSHEPGAVEEG
ncbi:serine/threonine-protein kinase [Pendulispora albinea]|uniref:Serine/threonine protein kinase n=1 Tax=Pendulispora albinea TaxID=2741071 RepID=A0ABZ2LRN1_9BACT